MKKAAVFFALFLFVLASGWSQTVRTVQNQDGGWELLVDGKQFFVKGVNWAINPPGTSFTFNLWNESDATIRKVLDTEGALMKEAGINAIKLGPEIPRKWIEYLYNRHGIYTIIHDTFSRWGASANGRWYSPTNYYVEEIRENLRNSSRDIVRKYMDASGVLMFMFGDGNGDGLYWSGEETPDILAKYGVDPRFRKARALFSLLEEVFQSAKELDPYHPVGFVTNDLGWVDLIAEECPSMDFLGVNINRGMQAGPDFWRDARQKINKPVVFASIGCDAWNAKSASEDQYHQAQWITSQWKDIYQNAYGNGRANALGGCVNEWTDNWYKSDYESAVGDQLSVHNTNPTLTDEGYWYDFTWGQPNMTPEWNGITSQGTRAYHLMFTEKVPRAAYYALQHIWSVDPWKVPENSGDASGEPVSGDENIQAVRINALDAHFSSLDLNFALSRGADAREWFPNWKISNQVTVTGMQSGNDIQKTIQQEGESIFSAFKDNQWGASLKTTFWGIAEQKVPSGHKLEGAVTLWMRHDAVIGKPITSIIYRTQEMGLAERPIDIYQAWFSWQGAGAEINARYHYGKGGWMGEGDYFNFNTECYDLFNNDIWDIKAPMSVEGRYNFGLKGRQGLAVIAGPRIYSGAKPMIIGKWYQEFAPKDHTFAFSALAGQEFSSLNDELGEYGEPGLYEEPNTLASLWFSWTPWLGFGPSFKAEAGVMTTNPRKIGDDYFLTVDAAGNPEKSGTINFTDTLAAKAGFSYTPISYFSVQAEVVHAGLVADTNYVPALMSTVFADIGQGNRFEVKGGITGAYGNFNLALNTLYRKPYQGAITDPFMPKEVKIANPFSVGSNRESFSVEAIFSFDLEPSTWIWEWNNWDTEAAKLATSLRGRYYFFEGASDPGYYKGADGKRRYLDIGYPETNGNYELGWMIFYNPSADLRIGNSLNFTRGFPFNGVSQDAIDENRTSISGWSETLKIRYKQLVVGGMMAFDLWGPVSSDRENNRTYPLRWSFDLAWGLTSKPSLMDSSSRVGVAWNGVIRDRYSTNAELGRDSQELVLFFDYTF